MSELKNENIGLIIVALLAVIIVGGVFIAKTIINRPDNDKNIQETIKCEKAGMVARLTQGDYIVCTPKSQRLRFLE